MAADRRKLGVVHRRASHALVGQRKAARLDHLERRAEARRDAHGRAEVVGNIWLKKDEAHSIRRARDTGSGTGRLSPWAARPSAARRFKL